MAWKKGVEERLARVELQLTSLKEDLKNSSDDYEGLENLVTENLKTEVDAFEVYCQETFNNLEDDRIEDDFEDDEDDDDQEN